MTKTTIRRGAAGILVAAVAVPGIYGATNAGAQSGGKTVVLQGLAFTPSTVKIKRGQTVTWRWRDGSIPHNIRGNGFGVGTKKSGTYRKRFTRKGTFRYVCTIHPTMKGRVVVS